MKYKYNDRIFLRKGDRTRAVKRLSVYFFSKILVLLIVNMALGNVCHAQVYKDLGKNRFTFAQTTIGYEMEYTPSVGKTFRYHNGQLQKFNFGNSITPVFTITGLHFWGRAEFFTSFSFPSFRLKKSQPFNFSRYAGTGFKYFILPIRKKGLSPFVGTSVGAFSYRLENGADVKRVELPMIAGLSYSFTQGLIEVGVNYYTKNDFRYFVSRELSVPLTIPALAFCVDYKYFFDLSLPASKSKPNPPAAEPEKLNSFFIAVGPAYAFILSRSSYNSSVRKYLDDYRITRIFPDIGFGYHHFKTDAALNLSYRAYAMELKAFDIEQTVQRQSFALEAYKFIGDYHGFVPFIGPLCSRERISVNENESGFIIIDQTKEFWAAGIIAGWDIRPRRDDWWGIRTNIRYFPKATVEVLSGLAINLRQIEVNFLQLVVYPNRLRNR